MKLFLILLFLYGFFIYKVYCDITFRQKKENNEISEKIVNDINKISRGSKALKWIECKICKMVIRRIQYMIQQRRTDEEVEDVLVKICRRLNVENYYVCDHIIHRFAGEVVFVLTNAIITPSEICGAIIKDCGLSENPLNNMWSLNIPGNKPPVKPWPNVIKPQSKLRVLHLTDIHIDNNYTIGSEAQCDIGKLFNDYNFCCRTFPSNDNYTAPKNIRVPAGYWGSPYNCDIPYRTFINAMEHISKNGTFDYIIVTGDLESHDIWDYSRTKTMNNIFNITNVLNKYFPNTPIYQATGNHEGVPMDAMGPHNMPEYQKRGPSWLYNTFAKAWKRDLPKSTQNGIKYRASYSVKPYNKLKIISLNTVYCSAFNFYLYINQTDPDGTLEWLSKELLDSELKGEKVHIISHIPPGLYYCLKGWSFNFYKLVNRFENTIAFIAMGHTHNDQFEVYYEDLKGERRPTHVNWIAPGLTTFSYSNPAYRVYEFDGNYEGSSFTILEAETYYANISEATITKPPVWKLEYKFTKEYDMPNLSPKSFDNLIRQLETNQTLFNKYYFNYYRNDIKCNEKCKRSAICEMKSARSFDSKSFC